MFRVSKFFAFSVFLASLSSVKSQEGEKSATSSPTGTDFVAPTSDVVTKEVAPPFSFAVWDNDGKICIVAKFSATFTITYPSTGGEQIVSVNLPEDAQVNGLCGTVRQEPVLELSWPMFRLTMRFTTVKPRDMPVPESWELLSMELLYNTASPLFDGATNAGKKTAHSEEGYHLFDTLFGKSYFCPSPDVIPMYNVKKERAVLARLKDVKLQVYEVQMGIFSTFQRCSLVRIGGIPEPFAQDETVPIAVGSTLAVVSVLVVIGYALWRNMAVRVTDYDTME